MEEESEIARVRGAVLVFSGREALSFRQLARRISRDTGTDVSYSTVRRFLREEGDTREDHLEAFRRFADIVKAKDSIIGLGESLATLYPLTRSAPPQVPPRLSFEGGTASITREGRYWRIEEVRKSGKTIVLQGAMVWTGTSFFALLYDKLMGDQLTYSFTGEGDRLTGNFHYMSRMETSDCGIIVMRRSGP